MEITRHWRLKAQRYRLAYATCPACGQPTFPPRPVCPRCGSQTTPAADGRLTILASSIELTGFESRARPRITESISG